MINLSLGGVRDPRAPEPRHVLAARGGGGRVRVREGRPARRGGRQRRRGVLAAVAVRELPGRAAARDRRQRADARRATCPTSRTATRSTTTSRRPGRASSRRSRSRSPPQRPTCVDQGYSDCGPDDYRDPEGTSFAAPQVSAAAALLFARRPTLTNEPGRALLEHSADDVNAATGCPRCALLRDPLSGWGRLDVAKALEALAGAAAAGRPLETNDDAGTQAHTLWGKQVKLTATRRLLRRPGRRLPRRALGRRAPRGEARPAAGRARTSISCSGSRARGSVDDLARRRSAPRSRRARARRSA